jgi:hypothetical protein
MTKMTYVREGVLVALAVMLGWWAHGSSHVVAAATVPSQLMYQFVDLGQGKTLTMYDPVEHEIYVYQSALGGNAHVNCSYRIHVAQAGAPLDRRNCAVGSLLP